LPQQTRALIEIADHSDELIGEHLKQSEDTIDQVHRSMREFESTFE
jgi:hypothetical protein